MILEFTCKQGKVFVISSHVEAIQANVDSSFIHLSSGQHIRVNESPDTIRDTIREAMGDGVTNEKKLAAIALYENRGVWKQAIEGSLR